MAIGYAGDPQALSVEKHRVAEQEPRARRSMSSFVFDGTWGKPLS
jgi:hypothetical protein